MARVLFIVMSTLVAFGVSERVPEWVQWFYFPPGSVVFRLREIWVMRVETPGFLFPSVVRGLLMDGRIRHLYCIATATLVARNPQNVYLYFSPFYVFSKLVEMLGAKSFQYIH